MCESCRFEDRIYSGDTVNNVSISDTVVKQILTDAVAKQILADISKEDFKIWIKSINSDICCSTYSWPL